MAPVISTPQISLAILGAAAGFGYAIATWVRSRGAKNPLDPGNQWPQAADFAKLVGQIEHEEVPTLLLARVDKLTSDLTATRNGLDTKASTLLGFLAGGVSVLAVLGKASKAAPPLTPLLTAGAAALVASLIFALAVLWAKPRELEFGLDNYCDVGFLKNPENNGRLAAMVSHSGIEKSIGLFQDTVDKGRLLTSAQLFFVLGAVLLALNSFVT